MSGSTIGSVVGAGIGWMVGGPAGAQWGWMIGGAVGAIVDPQTFETPRIDDFNFQSAQDGVPRVYGYGTYPVDQTWLMWRSEPRHVRKKKSAKGGPTQVTNTYYISYAIAVGAGGISGFKLIEEDGKVVFDARTDAELSALGYTAQQISETRAAQAKFLQNVTMYYGTADQMPDPTMVAVEGAGNVPAYRDTAYFVVKDKDITQRQSIPRYRVVVANCGAREELSTATTLLVTGDFQTVGGPLFSYADATSEPEFIGIPQSSGANIGGMTAAFYQGTWMAIHKAGVRFATTDLNVWSSGTIESTPAGFNTFGQIAGGPGGWLAVSPDNDDDPTAFVGTGEPADFVRMSLSPVGTQQCPYLIRANGWFMLTRPWTFYQSGVPEGPYTAVWTSVDETNSGRSPNGACIIGWYDFAELGGEWYAVIEWHFNDAFKRVQIIKSHDGIENWATFDIIIDVAMSADNKPGQLVRCGDHLVCYNTDGTLWTSANGWAEVIETGLAGPGSGEPGVIIAGGRRIVVANELCYCIGATNTMVVFDPETLTVSSLIELHINSAVSIAVGGLEDSGLTPIPDSPGHYIDPDTGNVIGPPGISIDPCQPTLGEIVAARCENRGVPRDVSELTDAVIGYRVAEPTTDQRIIQGLQPGYFFGASEFDGVLHFPKRGRELTFALTEADFVERDGDPIQWERTQETELLRKVTLAYLDPSVNYTRTTQDWERNAATIQAEGESTVELGITGSKDWAKQVAHKSVKVAWGEPDKATVHVSIARADLVTGAEGTAPYLDGSTVNVRIENIKDEGLVRMLELRRTRASLYESNATGASKPLPAFPGSDIRGPTDGLVLNIPVLVDANDVPGIHWAVAGFTSAWAGAQFQILRAGEWVVAGETTFAANTGTLLSPLPYHAGDVDTANVLHVRMGDELESVTFTQLLQERNPMAILRPDGTAEIVQPQTCVEVAPGEFECTTILRNRLDSGASAHAAGARVVFLDEAVEYASLQPTDIGQTLSYRFVSLGTDPDAAPVQTLELTTMESQREWPVADLAVEVDGDDYTLTWQPRHRLGSDVFPVRSTNWTGYEVSYSHPGGSGSVMVTTESHTFTLPGASDITFSVAQVNQFTGAGPAETVHIP